MNSLVLDARDCIVTALTDTTDPAEYTVWNTRRALADDMERRGVDVYYQLTRCDQRQPVTFVVGNYHIGRLYTPLFFGPSAHFVCKTAGGYVFSCDEIVDDWAVCAARVRSFDRYLLQRIGDYTPHMHVLPSHSAWGSAYTVRPVKIRARA